MGKVSIGLRGWRFEEDDLFTADGNWRPVMEIPEGPRQRLLRLQIAIGKPCDACYLIHGEEEKRRCNEAAIVYGEPLDEVLLCDDHEADFLYWFRERGGSDLTGEETFRDAFHEWFDDGGRAPEGYGGLDHVEAAPDDLPDLPDPEELYDLDEELLEDDRADFDGVVAGADDGDEDAVDGVDDAADAAASEGEDEDGDDTDGDDFELDLDREYPT
ncbi:hypothetical protein [Candidatus Halobonum tyrrellensis]|uniref:Uncharacterized protein n=1 Tax=Candidatus Halobonum tyrrellensis G22 TaxID=1324957 RepID=V4IYN2_9EURY|nr:hypothetical protein [Candidatus Halobonum tyrrellensis]ESP88242.1 hypothetical protein K933_10048 [Candidatus Halobonum tyrrellensis G22]